MKNSNSSSSNNTIKFFVAIFLVIVILVFSALAYYNYEEKVIKNQKYGELKAIAQLKKDQLIKWRTERLSEAAFFPAQLLLIENTKKLIENKDYKPAKDFLYSILNNLKINHSYQNIFISSFDNKILYSLDPGFNTLDTSELHEMKKVFESKEITIKDFYYCNTHKEIHLDFISPIINENQKTIAVLILRINPNDYLFPLIEKWPLPSETGESFLFRIDRDKVVYLNPLEGNRNQTLSLKNTLDEKDLISVKGALGLKGIVEGIDYSGHSVLADLNSIDGTPWFIVSKIDQNEVYSELRYRATAIAFVVILSLLVFTSGILLLYKYRQSNLYKELFLKERIFRRKGRV